MSDIASGIDAMVVLKWSEFTCASPASRSLNASARTNWLGLSTLLDHSKKMLPGSARVAVEKSATSESHSSLRAGRTGKLDDDEDHLAAPVGFGHLLDRQPISRSRPSSSCHQPMLSLGRSHEKPSRRRNGYGTARNQRDL